MEDIMWKSRNFYIVLVGSTFGIISEVNNLVVSVKI